MLMRLRRGAPKVLDAKKKGPNKADFEHLPELSMLCIFVYALHINLYCNDINYVNFDNSDRRDLRISNIK